MRSALTPQTVFPDWIVAINAGSRCGLLQCREDSVRECRKFSEAASVAVLNDCEGV
jgi:hypothetical protein